ncbi:glycerol-3-phosphate dehydrogenase [Terrihabitans soli]|nr:glycerol-3-phosphate dehydrogenase [Terrihabitans soli]
MAKRIFDIAIIGGGVNGCGIARDAAGRGFAVYLCEQNDLASGTSSASTKLVHGGLRYLEQYEFRLVREALHEREVLLNIAPHIVRPLRFILPHHEGLRPRWLLRLGLFLYDALGGRKRLPPSRAIDLTRSVAGRPLKDVFSSGFEYSDCWVEDARLVVLNAVDAKANGASINPRTKCVSAKRDKDLWRVVVVGPDGKRQTIHARTLVNAAGPWIGAVLHKQIKAKAAAPVRLVKGSHIVVPKLFGHDRAYIFQNADGRVEFAIPFEKQFTLIGTTDQDFRGDPADAAASKAEVDYLCRSASAYFGQPVKRKDVVWSYSGVRPLYDDGSNKAQNATRDYVLKLEGQKGEAPLLNIFGGKITTYRRLAEEAIEKLEPHLGRTRTWTSRTPLPGGNFAPGRAPLMARDLRMRFPFLTPSLAHRLVNSYGTRAPMILGHARSMRHLGESFGAELTAAEVRYLTEQEFAVSSEDILWRRSRLGLHVTSRDRKALETYLKRQASARPGSPPSDRSRTRRSSAKTGGTT